MSEFEHKELAVGFQAREPETDEEFIKLLKLSREPSVRVEISEATAKRFAHLVLGFDLGSPEGDTTVGCIFENGKMTRILSEDELALEAANASPDA